MSTNHFSAKTIAAQVAGSCRLEGIKVSADDEQMMCDIISGKIDATVLRRQIIQQYRSQNSTTLKIAAS